MEEEEEEGDESDDDGGIAFAADEDDEGGVDAATRDALVANLMEGQDPFKYDEKALEACHAIYSTLWELTLLEKHFLPAVPLMVSAFASPAEDTTPLKFEKTYGRLFTAEVTRKERGKPTLAYRPPQPAANGGTVFGMATLNKVVAL